MVFRNEKGAADKVALTMQFSRIWCSIQLLLQEPKNLNAISWAVILTMARFWCLVLYTSIEAMTNDTEDKDLKAEVKEIGSRSSKGRTTDG